VFWLGVAIGGAGLLAGGAAVAAAAGSVQQVFHGAHSLAFAGLHFTYPTLNGAAVVLVGLAALGASIWRIAVRTGWRQRQAYRGFLRLIGGPSPLHGHRGVNVIDDAQPLAFCAGYLRPAIYVSRGALGVLSGEELEAVLAHEHHHRRVRDPLRFACSRLLGQALFFLPVLRALSERDGSVAELQADEAAVRAGAGDKGPLASAMLAFESSGPAHGAGISPERVDSLLGRPARWRAPLWLTATSLATLSSLAVLLWQDSAVASIRATLNLPILSSRPCLVMLALLTVLACIPLRAWQRRGPAVGRLLHT
jgi:Zn-dependent protease with chaperone function